MIVRAHLCLIFFHIHLTFFVYFRIGQYIALTSISIIGSAYRIEIQKQNDT